MNFRLIIGYIGFHQRFVLPVAALLGFIKFIGDIQVNMYSNQSVTDHFSDSLINGIVTFVLIYFWPITIGTNILKRKIMKKMRSQSQYTTNQYASMQ